MTLPIKRFRIYLERQSKRVVLLCGTIVIVVLCAASFGLVGTCSDHFMIENGPSCACVGMPVVLRDQSNIDLGRTSLCLGVWLP